MLRKALGDRSDWDESLTQAGSIQETPPLRYEHYELVMGEDGKPVELGRGAMGVTYKAIDVDLHRPVTLKVIAERYLTNESARLRFLREARAAARVRHTNVAPVFHLGRSGQNYFYAMEFIDGDTLEDLLNRSGRLQIKLALEITSQVAAGLAAVHKLKLVHRDIKPSNIMVSFDEADEATAKIIDLGLAKPIDEVDDQNAISFPGAFAGTPAFASPEQFTGLPVDIRSDLYSLGVTLWNMLCGETPFRGTPAELMQQHMHAPLNLAVLGDVPQPVSALVEVLLEKDPARRLQSPAELLNAIGGVQAAVAARRRLSRQSLQRRFHVAMRASAQTSGARPGPRKISIARLPVTGSDVFGREEEIAFLDSGWANRSINVITVVAWAGVGKSTLVNHWLRRMAIDSYRSAELVYGWSFYRHGTSGKSSSVDEFFDAALRWFGDRDPRICTAWEKGERLAKLIANRRTLLVLDGLEPLQNPPGPQEGRLREHALQALIRELAAFNKGLCVITTRMPITDIVDSEGTSVLRRDLEQLFGAAGANLLRALGVKGDEADLRAASDEFDGHCLALTLLGSYLADVYHGDIRYRREVSKRLANDVRQGVHARRVMESYQTWFGEGPELSVLRMLGLFDRPVDEKTLGALLKPPVIAGLTESFTVAGEPEWRTIVAKLRRARLLAGADPHNPGQLDTHPLVREYFGEQLRSRHAEAWKDCNRRLYHYYRTVAPELPDSLQEMEPLFLAVICGCNCGLYREALDEVYIPRIQRGDALYAANALGARGPLLSVLVNFFENGRWGSPIGMDCDGRGLTPENQLYILMQAGMYLTATRGLGAPEARLCYDRAESLCQNRPLLYYLTLMGQWRYSLMTGRLSAAMQIAQRIYSLAQDQNDATMLIGAYRGLACTLYRLGDFETARQDAAHGFQIWRSGAVQAQIEEVSAPAVSCLYFEALCKWHLGEIPSCHDTMAQAISLAKELHVTHTTAESLFFAAVLNCCVRNYAEVERLASQLIELSTLHNFSFWLAGAEIFRGWARSFRGDIKDGLAWIDTGIGDYLATGATLGMPSWLGLKAEALHLADRTAEALQTVNEAIVLTERFEERSWLAELYRLRGVFLAAVQTAQAQIEASFSAAINTAKQQNSRSLAIRAEESYRAYSHVRDASRENA
jgi:serine/threonine protein kinase/tetratricopeptide (TPR) repeat protein